MKHYLKLLNKTNGEVFDVVFEYGSKNDKVVTTLKFKDLVFEYSDVDVYGCFMYYRKTLEEMGYFFMCNGGRIDTRPSGMLRDMSNGFRTYLMTIGQPTDLILEVFDYSEDNIGTLEEQEIFYKKWKKSLPREN